ncbi:MAG: murein biosynthesis integral membrane protein MurJ [Stigonema ocellatum SAG 48.90 = DSM 106950]|nr:murein biosynthesis integral membrane protein MurJ [Stigonema ocellatum SAG 48.90 = DSM 106950]
MTQKQNASRSLAKIAGIVASATLISKLFGLVRQLVVAADFGLGPAADAFTYAYTIPGFLLILLGGINGPFYSAVVSVLAKRKKEEAAPLVETITTLVGGILLIVTIFLVIFAPYLIDLFAPGLKVPEKELVREIAIQQLRIMAPMAVFAGLIGIGFGVLNAANQFWLPSVSPLISSATVIIGLGILYVQLGNKISHPNYAMLGGIVLAGSTLAGAVLQWGVQIITQARAGLGQFRLRFNFKEPGVADVLKIMLPATFSSGMLQINLYTDLFFASLLPTTGVAAALTNASLLMQTPLGIISNVILVPLLPMFSRLAAPENWPELKLRIRQGLLLSALTMLPLGAMMVTLAIPIVRVVYERGAFKVVDSRLVSSLLVANGIGMFVYLGRDVLVRVFYALGDGQTPFRVSIISILLNAVFDLFLIKPFGAPGVVLATVVVNCCSVLMLLWLLNGRLNGLPWQEWSLPILGLTAGSMVAGAASFGTLEVCEQFLGRNGLLIQLLQLCIAGFVGLCVFGAIAASMKLPEVNVFVSRLRQRFLK